MSTRTYRPWSHRRQVRQGRALIYALMAVSGTTIEPGPYPYPLSALAESIGLDPEDPMLTSKLATSLGIDRSWVRRCHQDAQVGVGLTATAADHWAARAGLHADIVWPGWWEDPSDIDPLEGEDDPPLEDLDPISEEQLAARRAAFVAKRTVAA